MSASTNFETQLVLTVQNALVAALGAAKVQRPGVTFAATEDDAEWVALYPLAFQRQPSRAGVWVGAFLFQVSCFARTAANRSDGDALRPTRLAGAVRVALEDAGLAVKTFGDVAPGQETTTALMRIGKARTRYVGEPESDVAGAQAPAAPSQIHAAVVEFAGIVTKL